MKIKLLVLSVALCAAMNSVLFAQTDTNALPAASPSPTADASSSAFPLINNGEIYLDECNEVEATTWDGSPLQGTTFTLTKGQSTTIIVQESNNQPTWVSSSPKVIMQTSAYYSGVAYSFYFTGMKKGSTDLTFSCIDDQGNPQSVTITIQVVDDITSTNALSEACLGPEDNGGTFTLSKSAYGAANDSLQVHFYCCASMPSFTLIPQGSSQILTPDSDNPYIQNSHSYSSADYYFYFTPSELGTTTLNFTYDQGSGPQTCSFTINVVE